MTFHKSFAAATDSRAQSSTATRCKFLSGFTSTIENFQYQQFLHTASTKTCFESENQVFEVVSKQDMLLKRGSFLIEKSSFWVVFKKTIFFILMIICLWSASIEQHCAHTKKHDDERKKYLKQDKLQNEECLYFSFYGRLLTK